MTVCHDPEDCALLLQAQAQASGVFDLGVEQNTVALTMQRLRRQAVQITRPKHQVNIGLLAKMKMMGSSMKKKVRNALRYLIMCKIAVTMI